MPKKGRKTGKENERIDVEFGGQSHVRDDSVMWFMP